MAGLIDDVRIYNRAVKRDRQGWGPSTALRACLEPVERTPALPRLRRRARRLEAYFGLPDEVEAAGDANEVFFADGALGKLEGLIQTGGRLAHFAADLRIYVG